MNDTPDWTTARDLADLAAEELGRAMVSAGLRFLATGFGDDGEVSIAFGSIREAEALMAVAVPANPTPGSLYDRATEGCVSLRHHHESGEPVSDEVIRSVIEASWSWRIHPEMNGRTPDWHVSVDLSAGDANEVTATLNSLTRGGAL